jgi:DNA-binding SARP family transcriptional activator
MEILHQAASALRRALEPDLPARFPSRSLRVENGIIQFLWPQRDPPEDCIDFVAFRQAYARRQWEAALELYQGDFMCEVPFANWAAAWRQQYASLHQRALLEAARARQAGGDHPGALDLCLRLHKIEPWHEEAVLLGMQTALACGDSATARRLYRSLEKALSDDLGETPRAELRALYQSIFV